MSEPERPPIIWRDRVRELEYEVADLRDHLDSFRTAYVNRAEAVSKARLRAYAEAARIAWERKAYEIHNAIMERMMEHDPP